MYRGWLRVVGGIPCEIFILQRGSSPAELIFACMYCHCICNCVNQNCFEALAARNFFCWKQASRERRIKEDESQVLYVERKSNEFVKLLQKKGNKEKILKRYLYMESVKYSYCAIYCFSYFRQLGGVNFHEVEVSVKIFGFLDNLDGTDVWKVEFWAKTCNFCKVKFWVKNCWHCTLLNLLWNWC